MSFKRCVIELNSQVSQFEFDSVERAGIWLRTIDELKMTMDTANGLMEMKAALYDVYMFHQDSRSRDEKWPIELTSRVRRLEYEIFQRSNTSTITSLWLSSSLAEDHKPEVGRPHKRRGGVADQQADIAVNASDEGSS